MIDQIDSDGMPEASQDESKAGDAFWKVSKKEMCSSALYLFLNDFARATDLFHFMLTLASNADRVRNTAARALIGDSDGTFAWVSTVERTRLENVLGEPNVVFDKLRKFSSLNSKNITNGFVDSFLWFLSIEMQEALRRQPKALMSKEKIEIEELLRFSSKRELINHLVDRKISSLSYGGILGIEAFISDTLGIELFDSSDDKEACKVIVEIRNINAHNRGVVNKIFQQRTSGTSIIQTILGDRIHLDYDKLVFFTTRLINVAMIFDQKICSKFKIRRKRFENWEL